MRFFKILLLLSSLLVYMPAYSAEDAANPPKPKATKPPAVTVMLDEKEILTYLQEAITWKSTLAEEDLPPDNARVSLIKDGLRQNAQKILKNGFDFGRFVSPLLEKIQVQQTQQNANSHATLFQRIAENSQHIEDLKKQLDDLDEKLETAKPAEIKPFREEKEKISGLIKVANARQDLMNNFAVIFNGNGVNEDASFAGALNKLSHSIITDLSDTSTSPPKSDSKENTQPKVSDDGLLAIFSEIFSLSQKKNSLGKLTEQANSLKEANNKLVNQMRIRLKSSLEEGDAIANAPMAEEETIVQRRQKLDNWVTGYKKLSNAVLPLGQVTALLDATLVNMKEWQTIVEGEWGKVLRHFLLRFVVLFISLMVPFVFLEFSRRAAIRYVKDPVRLRQINVARQLLFFTFITLLVFLNFFTEFGSLATYAGFLTAGLAVALQTVLVSLTAHFFFFGRFGVRAGDRVTISGVTGDVIQVGILRLYLMELIGNENDLRPSGKIVAFPNSILFNASAFSKKISEKNYRWNDLSFVIDSTADFAALTGRIMEIVNEVYKSYSKSIEKQHWLLEQSTNLTITVPSPKSDVSIRDNKIICDVHYPVLAENAVKTYEEIIQKLMAAFLGDAKWKLILSTPIRIELAN